MARHWMLLATAMASAAVAQTTTPESTAIHETVARHIAAGDISGAIVLVNHAGKQTTLDAQGLSSFKDGGPLRADSVMWIASMTKPVATVAMLMLIEQGKVSLNDPISKYLPTFHDTKVRVPKPGSPLALTGHVDPKGPPPEYDVVPANRPLIIRDFLTFSSGLQTIGIPNDTIPPISPTDTLSSWVPKLGASTLDFQPGSRFGYSNATSFEVVARIVEIVSGMTFDKFVQQHIFTPLEMKDTNFGPRADLAGRTVPLGGLANIPIMQGHFPSASAGLLSTASDYSHFAQMLLDGGIWHGRRLLKADTVRQLSSNQIGARDLAGLDPSLYGGLTSAQNPGVKYGFGVLVVVDNKAAGTAVPNGSFGWDGVGTRRWWAMPAKKTVLVMLVPEAARNVGAAPTHRDIEAIVAAH